MSKRVKYYDYTTVSQRDWDEFWKDVSHTMTKPKRKKKQFFSKKEKEDAIK